MDSKLTVTIRVDGISDWTLQISTRRRAITVAATSREKQIRREEARLDQRERELDKRL